MQPITPLKVGITGQAGFIGTHLFNTLGLYPLKYQRVLFEDDFFSDVTRLDNFVAGCDVIVHLAAVNRHHDQDVIYNTNIQLVRQLTDACERTKSSPKIIFSSSTQETRENPYGLSKKEGRRIFEAWAMKNNAAFTGMIIPNVFGPFGNPFYNSVVATFCHQLTRMEQPLIEIDAEIKLIYINELIEDFLTEIDLHGQTNDEYKTGFEKIIAHTSEIKVSGLLEKLTCIRDNYFQNGMMPDLDDHFVRNLFNTFITFIDLQTFYPRFYKMNTDNRGSFVEIAKISSGGQVSFSTTLPGITRGNHFHTRKAERFAVVKGNALIQMRKIGTDQKLSFKLSGDKPSFADMPVWYTHNITNTGSEDLYTMFWINEHFNPEDPDTFFEVV